MFLDWDLRLFFCLNFWHFNVKIIKKNRQALGFVHSGSSGSDLVKAGGHGYKGPGCLLGSAGLGTTGVDDTLPGELVIKCRKAESICTDHPPELPVSGQGCTPSSLSPSPKCLALADSRIFESSVNFLFIPHLTQCSKLSPSIPAKWSGIWCQVTGGKP